jgi:outer membrane lipoprotein-sorting protein
MKRLFLVFTLLCLPPGAVPASATGATAAAVDVKAIVARADRARGNIDGILWTIDIQSTENGRHQKREIRIKNRGVNTLAVFLSPAKVRNRMLLMLDRNMWFIKPGLRKPVPISPRQKLMGGAANGDIASTNYAKDYRAVLTGEEAVAGEMCYLLDLTAVNPKATYDRIRYWVSKSRSLGIKAEFYTVSGKLLKTARFKYQNRVETDGAVHAFMSRMTITDAVINDNVTVMAYRDIQPRAIPDATFNLNLLVH